jgi:hypothetical protein
MRFHQECLVPGSKVLRAFSLPPHGEGFRLSE